MKKIRFARWWAGRRVAEPDLGTRISCFREVLHANNAALGYLAAIQQALTDGSPLSPARVRRLVAGVTTQTYRMIVNLNRMTRGRFPDVVSKFEQIKSGLARLIEIPAHAASVDYVVALDRLQAASAEVVGQKSAFLGEARRLLAGYVPTTSERSSTATTLEYCFRRCEISMALFMVSEPATRSNCPAALR